MSKTGFLFVLISLPGLTLSAQSPAPNAVQYQFSLSYAFSSMSTAFNTDAVDTAGNVYFSGSAASALPTTPGAFQTAFTACPAQKYQPPCSWAFVGKLSPAGTLLWLTYLPEPNGSSAIQQIAVDGAGNVYLAGTYATVNGLPSAFPVTSGAYETASQGTYGVFLAKLNSTGSKLVWATYLNGINSVDAIQSDNGGNLFLAALSQAQVTNLPLVDPLSGTASPSDSSNSSAYLVKLNAAGSALLFASWLSTPGGVSGIAAMTMDGSGNLYVAGQCANPSAGVAAPCVPTTPGAYQATAPTGQAVFVMKLNPDAALAWSTLLSGSGVQQAHGIAVDAAGDVTLTGGLSTTATGQQFGFPTTPGAFQTNNTKLGRGGSDTGFLTKLNASGSSLLYATYFGGSSYDYIGGLVLDSSGDAVFSGVSDSPDLPVTSDAWEPCHPPPDFSSVNGADASFFGVLSADGRTLNYSSFIGLNFYQSGGEEGSSFGLLGMDGGGDLYFAGTQNGFPTIMRYRLTPRAEGSLACLANGTYGYGSAASSLGLLRLRGNNIAAGRSLSVVLTATGSLPISYDGLQVFFDEVPAPLLAVAPDEITVFAPGVATSGTTPVRITQNGLVTAELDATAEAAAPGIITIDGSGVGSAVAINQDGSVNSQGNPAAPGSVLSLYLTGLGNILPEFPVGTVAPLPGSVEATTQVTLYNVPAQVLYAGPAPGLLVGIYQVNFQVPVTGISDWVPLGVTVAGQFAQSEFGNAKVGVYVSCPPGSTCRQWPE